MMIESFVVVRELCLIICPDAKDQATQKFLPFPGIKTNQPLRLLTLALHVIKGKELI